MQCQKILAQNHVPYQTPSKTQMKERHWESVLEERMRYACGSPRSKGGSSTESTLIPELLLSGTVEGSGMSRRNVNVTVMSVIILSTRAYTKSGKRTIAFYARYNFSVARGYPIK